MSNSVTQIEPINAAPGVAAESTFRRFLRALRLEVRRSVEQLGKTYEHMPPY